MSKANKNTIEFKEGAVEFVDESIAKLDLLGKINMINGDIIRTDKDMLTMMNKIDALEQKIININFRNRAELFDESDKYKLINDRIDHLIDVINQLERKLYNDTSK
jgi:hypothetical protein